MLIPKLKTVVLVHDHLIERLGGESGILKPESKLENAVQRPKTFVYGHEPFKGTMRKSAALAYAIITFHPFVDGNKRTGLNILRLTLQANEVNIAWAPYLIKYSVQAALDEKHPRHLTEDQFIALIMPLCSHSQPMHFLKSIRYFTLPRIPMRVYLTLLKRMSTSTIISGRMEATLLDWMAAGDRERFRMSLMEWELRRKQGYPKNIPAPQISEADFESI